MTLPTKRILEIQAEATERQAKGYPGMISSPHEMLALANEILGHRDPIRDATDHLERLDREMAHESTERHLERDEPQTPLPDGLQTQERDRGAIAGDYGEGPST